ncbi:TniQ family protein [Neorhizobium sp. BT27B]|uniref:TniQ family protein n=1 Tax=Neorhizobium sp. BT27B TaxID=3142625 RepID=UPI003D26D9CD
MNGLLRVPLFDDELLASWLSRLATANGRPSFQFCADLGIDHRRALRGGGPEVEKLSLLSGYPSEKIRRHAAVLGKGSCMTLFGETFSKTVIEKHALRVCPDCLAVDEMEAGRLPGTRRYLRAHWLLSDVRACDIHDRAIVNLGLRSRSRKIGICEELQLRKVEIEELSKSAPHVTATSAERFARMRFAAAGGHGELVDSLQAHVVLDFSRILGAVVKHGKHKSERDISADDLRLATAAGFDILCEGAPAVHSALDEFVDPDGQRAPYSTYGRLYSVLFVHRRQDSYAPLRELVMAHARLNVLPRAASMNSSKSNFKWTSITALARDTGLDRSTVRHHLVNSGAISENSPKSVSSEVAVAFRKEASDFIKLTEARRMLGCQLELFYRLLDKGLIARLYPADSGTPETKAAKWVRFVKKSEVLRFRSALYDRVTVKPEKDMRSVREASRVTGLSQTELLAQIIDGRHAKVASRGKPLIVDDLAIFVGRPIDKNDETYVSLRNAAVELALHHNVVFKLTKHGVFTKTFERTGRRFVMLDRTEVAEFKARYISVGQLVKETGIDRNTLLGRARAKKIEAVFPPTEVRGYFIRTAEREALLSDAGSQVTERKR